MTGDIAVRAAHALSAHSGVERVVVIGPARSKSFEVVDTADGCDYLIGSGSEAPARAREHEVPLLWDGDSDEPGVAVWGASAEGLTLALASRESDPRLIALAHPELPEGNDHRARFPDPIGRIEVADSDYAGRRIALGRSPNEFAACLAVGADRRVTIIDDGHFLSGVALAASVAAVNGVGRPVWEDSLPFLKTATELGLVMAEDS